MIKRNIIVFSNNIYERIFLFLILALPGGITLAQTCSLVPPSLFGQSQTAIYCKNNDVGFGILGSQSNQQYSFLVYAANSNKVKSKGGPLDGNGDQVSVAANMYSAADAGEYRVITTKKNCTDTAFTSFYAFYGDIDNLSITSWGSNAVNFRWAASGPRPAVTYEYAVTTQPDPNSVLINYLTTTDTVASANSLTSGVTYYIHVRVKEIVWNGNLIDLYFDCFQLPTQTISFVPCSGSATIGSLTPFNPVVCSGSNTLLTVTGGTTYQWFRDEIPLGITSSTYNATLPGQYRTFITTSAGCQGKVYSVTATQTSLLAGNFSGGGNFYSGDTVKLGIHNSIIGQTYKILRNGLEVYSLEGIGKSKESFDTIFYKFVMTSPAQAGQYTVRTINPYCTSLDFGSETVNLVTGVSICPGTSTSFTVPSAGLGYTYQWEVNTGTGFTSITNTAPYSGVTTNKVTLTNPPSTYYGYIYRCVATNGVSTVISSTRTLKFSVTWSGLTSNAWGVTSNWSCGVIPSANTDVIIPAGTLFSPIITSDVSCRSVDVKPGATIRVNGFKLTVTGK